MDDHNAGDAASSGQTVLASSTDPGDAGHKRYDRRLFLKMAGVVPAQ